MKIKSLLLGSAAAMVAVSGAQAADAIIAEPEPVEYVRICDAYGNGFFYIPGTETCLRISGYVRMQIGGESWSNVNDTPSYHFSSTNAARDGDPTGGYNIHTRARVQFDARSDTEWGTLRAFVRVQSTFGTNADGAALIDKGFIELGGLRMGYNESAWVQTLGGGATNWGGFSDTGMYYGYQERHLIAYTFSANGFLATISIEHDDPSNNAADWVPDIVGKVGYNAGWGAVWAKIAYDDTYNPAGASGWAGSIGAQINVPNMPGSAIRIIGFYADSDNAFGVGNPDNSAWVGSGVVGSPEFSILANYRHQFTSTFGVSVGFQYSADHYFTATSINSGIDSYLIELSAVWEPITNFEIRSELAYVQVDAPGVDGTVSGYLRFTRYF